MKADGGVEGGEGGFGAGVEGGAGVGHDALHEHAEVEPAALSEPVVDREEQADGGAEEAVVAAVVPGRRGAETARRFGMWRVTAGGGERMDRAQSPTGT